MGNLFGFIFLISGMSFSASSWAGVAHGGGGNLCVDGRHALNISELADTHPNSTGFKDEKGVRITGRFVKESLEVFGYLGFDILGGADDYNFFFEDVKVREKLKIRISEYLNRADQEPSAREVLKNFQRIIGAHPFLAFNDVIPEAIEPGNLSKKYCPGVPRAAIRFSRGFGFLSLPFFNDMTLNQQAWLLIHEAGRWVQQNFKNSKFSNTDIELLTRAIVTNDFKSTEVQGILKKLSSDGAKFLKINRARPLIENFYRDVVFEGPMAVLNDLIAVEIGQFPGTVDEWANQKGSLEVARYRERVENLLTLTNSYIHGSNTHGWKKDALEYHVMRLDMYRNWKLHPHASFNAFMNSTLATYAQDKLTLVFKEGRLDFDPRFLNQGENNILASDSGLEIPAGHLESCACARSPKQFLTLIEQSMTLSFKDGKRRMFSLPPYFDVQAFCVVITDGDVDTSGLNSEKLNLVIRPTEQKNSIGLSKCRATHGSNAGSSGMSTPNERK